MSFRHAGNVNLEFTRGVGPRKNWTVADMSIAWGVHQGIIAADPDDLEQHFASGLALQMSGSTKCDASYSLFCEACESFHTSLPLAIRYYQSVIAKMRSKEIAVDNVAEEICLVESRIMLLERFEDYRFQNESSFPACAAFYLWLRRKLGEG